MSDYQYIQQLLDSLMCVHLACLETHTVLIP